MPIFVGHNHLLYDIIYVLIGGFHYAIHLRSIWRRVVMLDLELCAEINDDCVVEIGTIVCDNPLGDAIPTDKVMFDEPGDHILSNRGK